MNMMTKMITGMIAIFLITTHVAQAASLYSSGTKNWGTTNANWGTVSGGPYNAATWNNANNDTAVFEGTAGTVTLTEGVTVGGLQFDTLNYLINSTGSEAITLASGATIGSSVGGDNSTTPKVDSSFAGTNGFTKTGTGRVFLNATSSALSGDISIHDGDLYARFEALGSGNIVFTGDANFTKVYGADGSTTKSFTINDGVSATIGGGTFYYNFTTTGVLAGNDSARLTLNMGGNTEKNFNNTVNTFSGQLTVNGGGTGSEGNNNGGRARFMSLADSSEKLIIYNSTFILNNGGVSMNFANRQLEILSTGGNSRIMNESTNPSVIINFAKDVLVTLGNTARTLILSGANTGNNSIAGNISNSSNGSGVLSLQKWNAGKWILSGTNTYTGVTTITGGTLVLAHEESILDTNTVNINGGKLEVTGRAKIATLQTNSVAAASGTYGSLSSNAENKTDDYFVGSGILYVGVDYPPSGTVLIVK